MSRYLRVVLDAESAQRGFLLTEDPRYLRGFDPAVRSLDPLLDRLVAELRASGLNADADKAQALRTVTGKKVGEMQTSLRLYGEVDRESALKLLDTDVGQRAMLDFGINCVRSTTPRLRASPMRARVPKGSPDLARAARGRSVPEPLLVVLVGALLGRDMRRRELETEVLGTRNRELDRSLQQRTSMLFHLSSSLQKVAEREKAALARELHDELGGLLVATKIDVSWLRKRATDGSDASNLRWERILRCMDEGLTLKRRVIESLRPTLLDNVGLDAALRWLVDETLRRQGIVCEEQYPESMPELTPDSRIAVFRVVQECLMNILKHAKAKTVLLRVTTDGNLLSVIVRDDGVGIDEGRIETPQSHGLLGMRHRIEALEGTLSVRSLGPGVGTELSFSVPLERIQNTGTNR
jgi:signal transduction histidine kinase